MFGMSLFDVFGSIAMGLTSLPMPREDEVIEYYYVAGTRLGTTETCTAQGFTVWFCGQATFAYNVVLCIYYVAAIFWRLDGLTIRNYLEPFFHLAPVIIGLVVAIPPLIYDLYNPSPWAAWCSIGEFHSCDDYFITNEFIPFLNSFEHSDDYPYVCGQAANGTCQDIELCLPRASWHLEDDYVECVKGVHGVKSGWISAFVPYMLTQFSIIFICLVLVCLKVFQAQRLVKQTVENQGETDTSTSENTTTEALKSARWTTRIILLQALLYIMAYLLTTIFPMVSLFPQYNYEVTRKLQIVFMPLQGFFNFLIFVVFKIVNLRKNTPKLSWWDGFRQIFFKGVADPIIISGITEMRVDNAIDAKAMNGAPDAAKKSRSGSESKSNINEDASKSHFRDEASSGGFFSMFSSWFGSLPSDVSYSENPSGNETITPRSNHYDFPDDNHHFSS